MRVTETISGEGLMALSYCLPPAADGIRTSGSISALGQKMLGAKLAARQRGTRKRTRRRTVAAAEKDDISDCDKK